MKTTKQHSKYWAERKIDWKTQYFDTHGHPHRELILHALAKFRFGSVLEVGCAAGANLLRIKFGFPGIQLGGVDISKDAIEVARQQLPGAHLDVGPAHSIFLSDKSVDITLTDACLIYIGPGMITKTLQEIKRVTRKHIVFNEFHCKGRWQRLKLLWNTGYYAYDYEKLLEKAGFYDIEIQKIPPQAWPGTPWEQFGYIITASC